MREARAARLLTAQAERPWAAVSSDRQVDRPARRLPSMPPLIHASAAPPKIQAHFILRAGQPRQGALNQAVGSGSPIRAFPGHLGRNENGTVRLSFGRTKMRNVRNNVDGASQIPQSSTGQNPSHAEHAPLNHPPSPGASRLGSELGNQGRPRDRACGACGPGAP